MMPGRKETVAFYPSRYLPATHGSYKTPVDSVRYVIIRDARPDEHAAVGELRVSAYRAQGLLPDGSDYAETLRGFGFGGDCTVLVAVDEADDSLIGTVTLEPFDPASELAQDDTEADIRAFAVAAQAQGKGVGRKLLLAAIEYAEKHGLRRLRLCTQPAMLAAQHLYAATGFSRTPERDFSPVPGLILRAYQLDLPAGRLFSPRHGGSHLSPPPLPLPAVTAPPAFRAQRGV
jgi:ribosomal protein S18 acetylase RimI-like enzyme